MENGSRARHMTQNAMIPPRKSRPDNFYFFNIRAYWYFHTSHWGYGGHFMPRVGHVMRLPKSTENYNSGGLSERAFL
jgi:hypothetical protein